MIPHILRLLLALFLVRDPAVQVSLLPGAHSERPGRDVLAHRRAAADVRALPDRDGSDELRVAADEGAVLDRRLILVHAVVVAGDGAGPDVHLRADLCV